MTQVTVTGTVRWQCTHSIHGEKLAGAHQWDGTEVRLGLAMCHVHPIYLIASQLPASHSVSDGPSMQTTSIMFAVSTRRCVNQSGL